MTQYLGEILVIIAAGLVATVVIPTITRLILKEINVWRKDNANRTLDALRKTLDYFGDNLGKYVNQLEAWADGKKKYSDIIKETNDDVDEWLKDHKD